MVRRCPTLMNPHHTVESAVDAWLTHQLEEMFSHIGTEDW